MRSLSKRGNKILPNIVKSTSSKISPYPLNNEILKNHLGQKLKCLKFLPRGGIKMSIHF